MPLPLKLSYDSLDWAKMSGRIPAIIQDVEDGKILFLAEAQQDDVQKILRGENPFPGSPPYHDLRAIRNDAIMPDCDGDALLVPAYTGACQPGCGGADGIFYERITADNLDSIAWDDTLLTAVLIDSHNNVLGLAYTNRQAVEETLTPKRLVDSPEGKQAVPADEEGQRYMTLWSRRRGLWLKGLTSGELFYSLDLRKTGQSYRDTFGKDALLYVVSPSAPGVGFCHEKYSDLGQAGEGYFLSCFHRKLTLT